MGEHIGQLMNRFFKKVTGFLPLRLWRVLISLWIGGIVGVFALIPFGILGTFSVLVISLVAGVFWHERSVNH